MKIADYFSIALNDFKGNKKKLLFNTLSLVFLFLIILVLFTFLSTINGYVENVYHKGYYLRTYSVFFKPGDISYEETLEKIKKMEHVTGVFTNKEYLIYTLVNKVEDRPVEYQLYSYGATMDSVPRVVQGRNFEEGEENVVICPTHMLVKGNIDDLFEGSYVDGIDLLNKTITISINEYDYTNPMNPTYIKSHYFDFKVIGLYDAKENFMDNDACFMPVSDIQKLTDVNHIESQSNSGNFYLSIDSNQSLELVLQQLRQLEQEHNLFIGDLIPIFTFDMNEIDTLTNAVFMITSICLTLFLFTLLFFIRKLIQQKKMDIGLWKAMGYRDKQILNIIMVEQLIIILVSFLLANVLLLPILGIIYYLFSHVYYSLLRFTIYYPFLYSFASLFFILIINYFLSKIYFRRIKNISSIDLLKE